MLQDETGPGRVFEKLREKIMGSGNATLIEGFQCFYCLSTWVAVPFALYLGDDIWQMIVYLLGLAAVSVFINILHLKYA